MMDLPQLVTSLSPRHVGKTSQSKQVKEGSGYCAVLIRTTYQMLYCYNYLLQTGAEVAAEDIAYPVNLHVVDAGLHITLPHPLQVFLLSTDSILVLSFTSTLTQKTAIAVK